MDWKFILAMSLPTSLIAIVAILVDAKKKRSREKPAPAPPIPPAPPGQTSVAAGLSFLSGLASLFLVTSAALAAACVSMSEVTGLPDAAKPTVDLAARMLLYVSLLPAVAAIALALVARGAIAENRPGLRGRSLYRSAVFLSVAAGVLVFDARVVNPASWKVDSLARGLLRRTHDGVNHPFLGVEYEDKSGPVKILRVVPASPADVAGVKAGDVVVTFDGATLESGIRLSNLIDGLRPSSHVALGVQRGTAIVTLTAVLTSPFPSLLELLEDAVTDRERITLLQTAGVGRSFTAEELKEVCDAFVSDGAREEAVTMLLPRVVDPQNAYQVLTTFVSGTAKQSVSRKILERIQSK